MTKRELIKSGIKVVVSVGVGCIVTNAVAFTTPVVGIGVIKKLCIGAGSFALSTMVSDKTTEYTDKKIDEGLDEFKKMMEEDNKKEEST